VTDETEMIEVAGRAIARSALDVLFNNAGIAGFRLHDRAVHQHRRGMVFD